jgi:MarR family transcriptional regulator, transcriptional regulator for hemolysin
VLEYDFESAPGHWVCMAAHAFQRAMNDELAPQGITYRQCQVLAWLALEGPQPQRDLAERMRIEPPTLVGILDRMERDGWIERTGCDGDRRKKLVRATPAAAPVWSTIVACGDRVRQRALQGISQEQLESLREILQIMRENLGAEAVLSGAACAAKESDAAESAAAGK